MLCYQCEQTAGGTGCTKFGVCGKSLELAALQEPIDLHSKRFITCCHGV
ncbi:hypothetical protein ACFL0D_03505 [Thermoproteota archaeon]